MSICKERKGAKPGHCWHINDGGCGKEEMFAGFICCFCGEQKKEVVRIDKKTHGKFHPYRGRFDDIWWNWLKLLRG